jgi:hypothetical protein
VAGGKGASGDGSEGGEGGADADAGRTSGDAAERAERACGRQRRRCIHTTAIAISITFVLAFTIGTATILIAAIDSSRLLAPRARPANLTAAHGHDPSDACLSRLGRDCEPHAPRAAAHVHAGAQRLRGRRVAARVTDAD